MSSSSDNDRYEATRHRSGKSLTSKVESLATTLEDTNSNLRDVDRLLGDYKELGKTKHSAVDKLKDDLNRTVEEIKDERIRKSLSGSRPMRTTDLDYDYASGSRRYRPTSPLRHYEDKAASDWEQGNSRRNKPPHTAVRFFDDMGADGHLHDMHQSIRDLGSDQWRMGQDIDRQIAQSNKMEHDSRQAFRDITATLRTDPAGSSVDRRLQSIQDEIKSEKRAKQEELGKISQELKQALQSQQAATQMSITRDQDNMLRSKLTQSDTQRTLVESELDHSRRQLDRLDGIKQALTCQVDDLRSQLVQSEKDRQRMREQMMDMEDRFKDTNRKRQVEERESEWLEKEKQRLSDEVQELRSQLGRSASLVSDYGGLRKELDQSEKQRSQLSDHIQVLNEEIEAKEKLNAKIVTQLQEISEKYNECERSRQQNANQLDDASTRLNEMTKQNQSHTIELHETKKAFKEMENKKEEIKVRAQETVRQWKAKCRKLDQDLEMYKKSTVTATDRTEQLLKELESTRSQSALSAQQTDHLKREFSQMLAMRAQQEEEVRIKDIQLNELKSFKNDLERDLRDTKMIMERLEHELHNTQEKLSVALEEKNRYEDQSQALQSSTLMAQSQCQQMQKEVKELSMMRVELAAQLAEAANQRQDLKSSLADTQRSEVTAKEEVEALRQQIKEDKHANSARFEMMRVELEQYKAQEGRRAHDASRHYKKERAEYEAELQALKIELQEERSAAKLARKQGEKLKSELDRIATDLAKSHEETSAMQLRYLHTKEEFLTKSQVTEDGLSKARDTELQLLDLKDSLRASERNHTNIRMSLSTEVDSVIEIVAADAISTIKSLSVNTGTMDENKRWLAETRGKLAWLKSEIQELRQKEKRLRNDVRDAVQSGEKDREFLLTEIERQKETAEHIDAERRQLIEKHHETADTVAYLKEEVDDLNWENSKVRRKSIELEVEAECLSHDVAVLSESHRERDLIKERYARLQDMMAGLREELDAPSTLSESKSQWSRSRSPGSKRRVRISSPPTVTQDTSPPPQSRCYSPTCPSNKTSPNDRSPSRSPVRSYRQQSVSPVRDRSSHSRSPVRNGILKTRSTTPPSTMSSQYQKGLPPLALTDEEFLETFIPKLT